MQTSFLLWLFIDHATCLGHPKSMDDSSQMSYEQQKLIFKYISQRIIIFLKMSPEVDIYY